MLTTGLTNDPAKSPSCMCIETGHIIQIIVIDASRQEVTNRKL